jgi:hypothetical protein
MSTTTCRRDHSFPWSYHETYFDPAGHLICPSCGTELERVWSFRTIYDRPTY